MINNFFNSDFAKHSKFNYDFVGNITNYGEWLTLANQYNGYLNNSSKKKKSSIPKRIHQIWLGKKNLPKKYLKWMDSWKIHNVNWEYKLWTEENIKELKIKNSAIYSKEINPGYRSDIIRYFVLEKYGGIYIDTDFECLRPIPNDLLNYKFVSCIIFGNKPSIANGMIMSTPNHILIKNILKNINTENYSSEIKDIINDSGPELLTRTYFSLIKDIEKETLILPSNYFYPYPNFLINSNLDRYNEVENLTLGIHHWEMSWMKGSLISRIKNKIKIISSKFRN